MKTEKYDIRFFHNKGEKADLPVGTACIIIDRQTGAKIAEERATLYYKDTFSKAKGRKEALKKALKSISVSREERKEVWTVYKNNFKLK